MPNSNLCPKCGYDYCICNLGPPYVVPIGAWPAPPGPDLDPGHKAIPDEELKRIKDSFPKHKPKRIE